MRAVSTAIDSAAKNARTAVDMARAGKSNSEIAAALQAQVPAGVYQAKIRAAIGHYFK